MANGFKKLIVSAVLMVVLLMLARVAMRVDDSLLTSTSGKLSTTSSVGASPIAKASSTPHTPVSSVTTSIEGLAIAPARPQKNNNPTSALLAPKKTERDYASPSLPGALVVKPIAVEFVPTEPTRESPPTVERPTSDPGLGMLDPDLIRERTNVERAANNLVALRKNTTLTTIAEAKAHDMHAKQYFAHASPSGVDIEALSKTYGYEYLNVGENLALGNFVSSTHVVTSWMGSPGHRANILNTQYTEIGIAAIEGNYEGDKVWFAVQEFGRPQSDCPLPDALLRQKILIYNDQLVQLERTLSNLSAELKQSGLSPEVHNSRATDYNTIVALFNSLVTTSKAAIAEFNAQADAFNACIGT